MKTINVGLVGSGFVSDIHATSLKQVPDVRLLAVASPTPGNAASFAGRFEIPHAHTDYRKLLEMPEIDVVAIGAPNDLHAEIALAAAAAGKHVICEKPLAMTIAEADAMVDACRKAKVKLMYTEDLFRAEVRADEGVGRQRRAGGDPHGEAEREARWPSLPLVLGRHTLRRRGHDGHGCHALCFFLWFYDWAKPESIYADMSTTVHAEKTPAMTTPR